MLLTWDEPKRLSNLAKHGLDFAGLTEDFFEGAIIRPAHKGRFKAIGFFHGFLIVAVIFAPLGQEAISLISLRPASPKEREML